MRKILFGLLMLVGIVVNAQVYNNEWIDYTKTYYKFRVGKDGVYRISGSTLASNGLGSAVAQDFQLWRNGVQVPLYTSVATGTLGASDYIEFWGKMNDGKPDKELYRDPGFQLNDKWSLITDSATYFLTVNPGGSNLRLQTTTNNLAGNTLSPDPYFLHTTGVYFKDKVNSGLFYVVGHDQLYSSSYDRGEGWTSGDIGKNATLTINNLGNLYPAGAGPAPTIKASFTGNAYNARRYKITINGDSVLGNLLPYMNQAEDQGVFNLSVLSPGTANIGITNYTEDCGTGACPEDKMVVHKLEFTYPRQFDFGGATNFEFRLAASAAGNYLEISGFNHGGVAPVLYDFTNGKRYVAELSGSIVRVVLAPSATDRNLVLAGQANTNILSIGTIQPRNFINYNTSAAQGDYLIISNPILFNGAGGSNPVEEYRAYRSSVQGGGYNAKVFLEEQLIDQFGFGIKKNPAGIRNFIRFARNKFSVKPKHVFIIGRGMHYLHQRSIDAAGNPAQKTNLEILNLIPSYGWPASDLLLSAEPGTSVPATPIGRLTAITPSEVSTYLKKVKEYELALQTPSPSIADKAWMKNIAHIAGAGEEPLASILNGYFSGYKRMAEDTLYGAKVTTFSKKTSSSVQQLSDVDLVKLFNDGVSVITYYGHSSATTLEFNLDDPANYNNQGKYPMFLALGCNAGNTFDYNEGRFFSRTYLSDKYVLAPDRGSINFIASTHFGVVHYLDIWNARAYNNMTRQQYGKTIGEIMKKTVEDVYRDFTPDDFFARCNAEEAILNGDPAIRLNQQAKPDYVITDDMVTVSPVFVSVADQTFNVKVRINNLGKAVSQKIVVETKREYPNKQIEIIRRDTIPGIRYSDSLSFFVPIDPIKDKGSNKILVSVDADNVVSELFETNNAASKEVVIYEEEARPIYPQDFTIVSESNLTLKASTANPFDSLKQYRIEIDTTEKFNSPLMSGSTISSTGGLIELKPGIPFNNGVVYYWRVAPVASNNMFNWNVSSFLYLNNGGTGYNQSHYFQHAKSEKENIILDSASRKWNFNKVKRNLTLRNTIFGTGGTQEAMFTVAVDGDAFIRSACVGSSLIFNVFDENTLKPWKNVDNNGNNLYLYGSASANCQSSRNWNFEFSYVNPTSRKAMMDFMDAIPEGAYVTIRSVDANAPYSFSSTWRGDTTLYGSNNSLYHKLLGVGFAGIDSLETRRSWLMIYQKGNKAMQPKYLVSEGVYDALTLSVDVFVPNTSGTISSPKFGPAIRWKNMSWSGNSVENVTGDDPVIDIIGYKFNGDTATLFKSIGLSQQSLDISSINAQEYRYLQLKMMNSDTVSHTPYQLDYWRLTFDPVPEGALAPNLFLKSRDTVEVGEPLDFRMAFKNITTSPFPDSLKVQMVITDRNNVQHVLPVQRHRPLAANDTLHAGYSIDTRNLVGANMLFININPDYAQPEQYLFNNFAYKNFYVKGDTLNPLIDVTFDNVHILNRDIVSSRPDILISLKDEAKWMLLNDTSIAMVQIKYPDGRIKTFNYNSDTLLLETASGSPNSDNSARIRFKPNFEQDGDYELIISGKDMSNNPTGTMAYRVSFQVINKPMISNVLNYPNPFTTSTAFVFTLTGSEVPQNLKIQILTVTGKIVKEITKEELGTIRIGRNITDYKWDGTDQYGQKLANGVYLYRVVTNLKGQSLEKYTDSNDATDKYFNKGYGKMYLMR